MLSPDSRTVAFDLLRPPAGYDLDFALVTTYTPTWRPCLRCL